MEHESWCVCPQIVAVGETVAELKREVEQLEQRNLQLLEEMQREQLQQLEISMYVLVALTVTLLYSHTLEARARSILGQNRQRFFIDQVLLLTTISIM